MLTVGKVRRASLPDVRRDLHWGRLAFLTWLFVFAELVLFTGCGTQPTFTTRQGVEVYVDKGVTGIDRDNTSNALSIVIDEALLRKPTYEPQVNLGSKSLTFQAEDYMTVDAGNGPIEVAGYTINGKYVYIAALRDACPFSVLSHEWGHVLASEWDPNDDHDHTDHSLFWDADSLEVVGKMLVREEVCGE